MDVNEVVEVAFQRVWPNGGSEFRAYLRPLVADFFNSGCADNHYLDELDSGDINKVAARVWEAMLFARFKGVGWCVNSTEKGPDFHLETQNGPVQAEAVLATPGDPNFSGLSREWQERSTGKAYSVPHEQFLTRWTNAIASKHKKFLDDIERATANPSYPFVIAVNSGLIGPDEHDISGAPLAAAAVLPFDPRSVTVNIHTGEVTDSSLQWRDTIRKSNNTEIRMDSFLDHEYACVSAIIGCSSFFVFEQDRQRHEGQPAYVIIHNPKARKPLPKPWLRSALEFVADISEDGEVKLKQIQ